MFSYSFDTARDLFSGYGLSLSREAFEQFCIYADYLLEVNAHTNLTAITNPDDIFLKHFLDSALLLRYAPPPAQGSVLDVGTGAGFPSVPLAILRQDLHLTLLDSLNKRVEFLKVLTGRLGIPAQCIHARAEEASRTDLRERFDYVTARAVAALPVLCEYCLPFVRVGGVFAAMKGPSESAADCQHACDTLGASCESIAYALEGEGRQIFLLKKISQTPSKYPRNGGQISKKPL